jgi:predicted HicB family RNase H-like nuclease
MIEYKGYIGVFEYDPEEEEFHGRIVNLQRDGATFVGRSVEELKREMAASVDELIAFCEEQGIEPEKPFPFSELDRLRYMVERAQARLAEHPAQSIAGAAQSMQAATSVLLYYSMSTPQPLGASSFDYLHTHRVSFSHTPEVGFIRALPTAEDHPSRFGGVKELGESEV